MSLGKKDIVNNISSETLLHKSTSKNILESFLNFIKDNQSKQIKISNFGLFYMHQSPKRIGRNPKTKEEFIIPKRKKLVFKPSSVVKKKLN
ncbi:MAG: transcriptional regulator [Rhodobacteraceae bacterium TMED111]|nr:MAG: transcriptional regulator [Rhodobacteraceae bacterium TMED111]